jgi:hypothetical protein
LAKLEYNIKRLKCIGVPVPSTLQFSDTEIISSDLWSSLDSKSYDYLKALIANGNQIFPHVSYKYQEKTPIQEVLKAKLR